MKSFKSETLRWVGLCALSLWLVACTGSSDAPEEEAAEPEAPEEEEAVPEARAPATPEELAKKAAAKKAGAKRAAAKKGQRLFVQESRTFGRDTQKGISECSRLIVDHLDHAKAVTIFPSTGKAGLERGCGPLSEMYSRQKRKMVGKHYTVDQLVLKVAKIQDSYRVLRAALATGKPGESLANAIVQMRDDLRSVKRTADSVAKLRLDAKPMHMVTRRKVTIGKIITLLKKKSKDEDRTDLGTLLVKFETHAFLRTQEGQRVRKGELGAYALVYKARLEARRRAIHAMYTDTPEKDAKVYKAADAYLDSCVKFVKVYENVSEPYLGYFPPVGKKAREGHALLDAAVKEWVAMNAAFYDNVTDSL